MLVDFRTNDAKSTDDVGRAEANVGFTRNVVKVNPFAVCTCNDTFGAEDDTVGFLVGKALERRGDFFCRVFSRCLTADACEHLISVMMVMVVFMVMVVTATGAFLAVVVVLIVMMVLVMVFIVTVVFVIVATAVAIFIVMVMVIVMLVVMTVTMLVVAIVMMLVL